MSMQILLKNRAKLSHTYEKAKTTMFFGFVTENVTKNNEFFGKLPLGIFASLLLCVIFLFVKALRQ
jgi:hypothetical protein